MQVSHPAKKTKTNGFDILKPIDILPFLMEKPNSLVENKPIIPLTQDCGFAWHKENFWSLPGKLKQKDTLRTGMFFFPSLDLL